MVNPDLFIKMGNLSKDAYFIFDTTSGKFQYLNNSFEDIWGISVQAVLGNPLILIDTVHPEDQQHIINCYKEFLEDIKARKYEFRVYSNSEEKYLRLSLYPVIEQGVVIQIAGIAEDVSAVKKNIFYMEKINGRKNSMLEILAHDLKGTIGMINMMASNIKIESADLGNQNILDSVNFIQGICKRNIELIRNLVNSEFLESIEVDLRKERIDIMWEIKDVVENYRNAEDQLAKTFILTSSADKIYLNLDTLKFMQAINNLISNALKFTPDNGIIKIDVKDLDNTVLITIADNGVGIPEDLQPFLFDKFTRARRTGLKGEEPVGLGMSIIKTIVELHYGKIWFESVENVGTTFFIEIPKN